MPEPSCVGVAAAEYEFRCPNWARCLALSSKKRPGAHNTIMPKTQRQKRSPRQRHHGHDESGLKPPTALQARPG